MKNKIISAMKVLSKRENKRNVFFSEADFQFSLGWQLIKDNNDIKDIIFEERVKLKTNEKESSIDIVLIMNDSKKIPIELKYFTKPNENYRWLKDQKDTWRSYDYIHDLKRIETYVNQESCDCGFAIVLTNHKSYWDGSNNKPDSNYIQFNLNNNREIQKNEELNWINPDAKSVKGKRKNSIILKQYYHFVWEEYFSQKEENIEFMFLLNEYKK